jgi:hypothetical protein
VNNNFGIQNARVVAPGSLARSLMYLRANANDISKMPPIARNVIDTNFVPVLAAWINSFVPGPLPSPWQHEDIGAVVLPGDANYENASGTFTIAGAGLDIWSTADSFHYAFRNVSGNCELIARVTSITDTFPWAKAGVMIRESLAPSAANACLALTSENGAEFQWRDTNGGPSAYAQGPFATAPSWLRLTRTNTAFTAYSSDDGINWFQLGATVILNLPIDAVVGLAVTAVNSNALNSSTFDSVQLNSSGTIDSDGDGMPDDYEIAKGFNPNDPADALQDADGDGVTNLQEFLAGTDPRDARSVFRITRLQRSGNDLVLSFDGGVGKNYAIERTTNLPALAWQSISNISSGTNASVTITNFGAAQTPQGFYRLRVLP